MKVELSLVKINGFLYDKLTSNSPKLIIFLKKIVNIF